MQLALAQPLAQSEQRAMLRVDPALATGRLRQAQHLPLLKAGGQSLRQRYRGQPCEQAGHGQQAPIAGGRVYVEFPISGDITLPIAPGTYDVVVSRGYEYEVERQTVTVTAGQTTQVDALLDHVVDTTGVQCADFHVHTWRSNDSGDDSVRITATAGQPADVALLGGAPAEGPILFSGPFVMDTAARLEQAKRDYASGKMGTLDGVPF